MRTSQTLGLAALTTLISVAGPAVAREKPPRIGTGVVDCAAYDAWFGPGACAEMCRRYQFSRTEECYIKDGFAHISYYVLWRSAGEAGAFEPAVLDPGVGVGVEIDAGGGILTLQAEEPLVVSWEAADGAAESLLGAHLDVAVGPGDRVSAAFVDPAYSGVVQLSLN